MCGAEGVASIGLDSDSDNKAHKKRLSEDKTNSC